MIRTLLAALLLSAGNASAATLTVFAAASLTDAFSELGRAFDARTGHRTSFQFAGSQTLRTQLEQGARADVYASANEAQYTPLVTQKLVTAGQAFARNRLTVIAPRTTSRVKALTDLARPGVKLVIADKTVPVGDYTRRMLTAMDQAGTYGRDFSARVLNNVVSEEPNVRQVALKVGLGEADAAVVFATAVTPTLRPLVRIIPLPTRFNQSVSYPIGTVQGSQNPEAARAFVAYVLSPDGQRILRKWGFQAPR